jgi:hypothetical protein
MIVLHVVRASMNALWEQSRKEISTKLILQSAQIAELAPTRAQQELLTLNDKTKGNRAHLNTVRPLLQPFYEETLQLPEVTLRYTPG